jgi:hypothetical protein
MKSIRPQPGLWFGKKVAPGKVPLKVNVFAHMMSHHGMLEQLPLFPYLAPGDIVPTAALSLALPEMPRVQFFHYNDVPEVIVCMASDGALLSTGQLYLQQANHGVNTFLRDPQGSEGRHYQISLIIFRLKEEGPQNEGFILRCPKCNQVVFRMDRDVWQRPQHPYYPELPSLRFYADAADAFNVEPRTCGHCGAAQARFPVELMGWRRYAQYLELANRARHDLAAAFSPKS